MSNVKPCLQPGDPVVVTPLGDSPEQAEVTSRIGNYAILSNGIRFHVIDDRKQQGLWYCEQFNAMISISDVV